MKGKSMDFFTAIKTVLGKYADFKGVASRSEYWWWWFCQWWFNAKCLNPICTTIATNNGKYYDKPRASQYNGEFNFQSIRG
jgi:hypothetical protein